MARFIQTGNTKCEPVKKQPGVHAAGLYEPVSQIFKRKIVKGQQNTEYKNIPSDINCCHCPFSNKVSKSLRDRIWT